MNKHNLLFLIAMLAACSAHGEETGSVDRADADAPGSVTTAVAAHSYEFVGTYEHIDTPMGASISVLMTSDRKIKIASLDRTRYVNIPMRTEFQGRTLKVPIPEILSGGTYGVNGEWKTASFGGSERFVVLAMEYFGGGHGIANDRERRYLPDFFTVDPNARGPLTLSELQIQFPDSLRRYFNDEEQACFVRQVERRAADMGDPLTMDPHKRILLYLTRDAWEQSTVADKRLQMARYVTSMAMGDC